MSILDAYKYLRRELSLVGTELLKEAGLGAKQAQVLICLHQNREATMGTLADYIQSDNAAATRIVAALTTAGLVSRSVSRVDRRQTVNRLTAKGQRKALQAVNVYDELNRRIESVLSPSEQKQLATLMAHVSDGLRERRGDEG